MGKPRIAVLFDAENVAAGHVEEVLRRLEPKGVVTIKVAIGDFSKHPSWVAVANKVGIKTEMQPCLGKGKNASDITLTIQAVDILRDGVVEVFALVSSDRDFTPLAHYLVRAGVQVIGFGKVAANNASYRSAFTHYEPLTKPVLLHTIAEQPAPSVLIPKLSASELSQLETTRATVGSDEGNPNWWSVFGVELRRVDPELHLKVGGGKNLKKTVTRIWAPQPA